MQRLQNASVQRLKAVANVWMNFNNEVNKISDMVGMAYQGPVFGTASVCGGPIVCPGSEANQIEVHCI